MKNKIRYSLIGTLLLIFMLPSSSLAKPGVDYLIVANAPSITPQQLRVIKLASMNKTLIALDGASDLLTENRIQPDIVLGDLDSIDKNRDYLAFQNENPFYLNGTLVIPAADQDHTDLEKAIKYCDEHGARSIEIINAVGGRLDHTLGNLHFLKKYHSDKRKLRMIYQNSQVNYVKDDVIHITGQAGDNVAVIAFPYGSVTSIGLAYDMQDYKLEFAISESLCNSLAKTNATIRVKGEALVVSPA